jgi:ABC-type nitrate/sulfonate/bicarbonate transport system permease component
MLDTDVLLVAMLLIGILGGLLSLLMLLANRVLAPWSLRAGGGS